jgi:hypothetical protein
MPPRAISPSRRRWAERSAGAGIASDPGRTGGPGASPESVSRSSTRGTGPTVAASVSSTLTPPVTAASATVAAGSPPLARLRASLSSPSRSRHRGQSPCGARAGSSEPQLGQAGRSAIVGSSLAVVGDVVHYPYL